MKVWRASNTEIRRYIKAASGPYKSHKVWTRTGVPMRADYKIYVDAGRPAFPKASFLLQIKTVRPPFSLGSAVATWNLQ